MRSFRFLLLTLALASGVSSLAPVAHARNPGVKAPGRGETPVFPNDFHMLTNKPVFSSCFLFFSCPLKTDPWGDPDTSNFPILDNGPNGPAVNYLNSWSQSDPLSGVLIGSLDFIDLKTRGAIIVDAWWSFDGDRLLTPVVFLTSNGIPQPFTKGYILSAAPEPDAWMMMIVGLGAIGFIMRNRRSFAPGKAKYRIS